MRLRLNYQAGTLSASATASDTDLQSDDFASLPVIAAPAYAMATLDTMPTAPDQPETVKITGHSAGTPTHVIVERAKEGSLARSHAAGVSWEHGASMGDWALVGADLHIAENFADPANTPAQNTAAINACFAEARAKNRAVVIDKGTFQVDGELDASLITDLEVVGRGQDSRIVTTHVTANVLRVGDPAGFDRGGRRVTLADFVISSAVTKTAGAAIWADYAQRYDIERVQIDPQTLGPPQTWEGLHVHKGDQLNLKASDINSLKDAVYLDGVIDAYLSGGNKLANVATLANLVAGTAGVHIAGGCGGISVDQSDIIYCDIAILIDTTAAGAGINGQVFLGPLLALDTCGDSGLVVAASSLQELSIDGTWMASHGPRTGGGNNGNGMKVLSPNAALNLIIGGPVRFYNNQGSGAQINAARKLRMDAAVSADLNGRDGARGGDGLYVGAAVARSRLHLTADDNGNGTRGTGIYLADGVNNYKLDAAASGNGLAQIREPAAASNRLSVNNMAT